MVQVNRNIVGTVCIIYLYAFFIMPLGDLLYQCATRDKVTFRSYERNLIKTVNATNRRMFNQFCVNEKVLPVFTKYNYYEIVYKNHN